ncbi:MAG: hypothetical protein ACKV2V_06265 [Blastocatellia bacterium]
MSENRELSYDERFSPERPNMCGNLRWKGLFVWAEKDDSVPPSNSAYFWCLHTQTCIGPDGEGVIPEDCAGGDRKCHNATPDVAQAVNEEMRMVVLASMKRQDATRIA